MAGSSTACRSMPFAFMVFTLANVGLPGTTGFVGEFLTLVGTFRANTWVAFFATYRRHPVGGLCAVALPQGDLRHADQAVARRHLRPQRARNRDSRAAVVLTIFFGVYPKPILDMSAVSVAALLENYQAALTGAKAARAGILMHDMSRRQYWIAAAETGSKAG